MRTLRPHRAPLAEDEARAELRRMAGAQLDPVIVAALERVLDRDVRRSDAA
jgi:HD-GYP domain-containing protein (c-di-GMP phosphodiesterase class II)